MSLRTCCAYGVGVSLMLPVHRFRHVEGVGSSNSKEKQEAAVEPARHPTPTLLATFRSLYHPTLTLPVTFRSLYHPTPPFQSHLDHCTILSPPFQSHLDHCTTEMEKRTSVRAMLV